MRHVPQDEYGDRGDRAGALAAEVLHENRVGGGARDAVRVAEARGSQSAASGTLDDPCSVSFRKQYNVSQQSGRRATAEERPSRDAETEAFGEFPTPEITLRFL